MTPERDDQDAILCGRGARGVSAPLGRLVDKQVRALRGFLVRMGAADAADDIAQEAFLKAWRFAGQYDGRARYATWLTRIAWRCHVDQSRRPKPGSEQATGESGDDPTTSIAIDDMLSRLGPVERASLILCEGHGWSHAEAAEMLSLPLGTLKSTVARAKAKCRAMWSDADE
jgi:RNA polymerase sigma factor (sigma-70 family)